MPTTADVIAFLKDLAGTDKVFPHTDIFRDLGMVGDDFHEMIETYAARYAVDMTNYRWYFHTDEEGWSFGGVFFKPLMNVWVEFR